MAKSYILPDEIEKAAQAFLKRYHPHNTLLIPIEEIIEFHLEIDIIPTPDISKANYQNHAKIFW